MITQQDPSDAEKTTAVITFYSNEYDLHCNLNNVLRCSSLMTVNNSVV